jgi:hypothetical protein
MRDGAQPLRKQSQVRRRTAAELDLQRDGEPLASLRANGAGERLAVFELPGSRVVLALEQQRARVGDAPLAQRVGVGGRLRAERIDKIGRRRHAHIGGHGVHTSLIGAILTRARRQQLASLAVDARQLSVDQRQLSDQRGTVFRIDQQCSTNSIGIIDTKNI